MNCLICGGDATEYQQGGDYRHFTCGECGGFKISGTLLEIRRGRVFDVESTRERFRAARLRGELPVLTTFDEDLLREPES